MITLNETQSQGKTIRQFTLTTAVNPEFETYLKERGCDDGFFDAVMIPYDGDRLAQFLAAANAYFERVKTSIRALAVTPTEGAEADTSYDWVFAF